MKCKQNAKSASSCYLGLMLNERNKSFFAFKFSFFPFSYLVLRDFPAFVEMRVVFEVNPASVVLYLNVNQFKPVHRRCNFSTRNEHHLWYVMILFSKLLNVMSIMALFGWWFMPVRALSLSLWRCFEVALSLNAFMYLRSMAILLLLFSQPSHYVVMQRRIYFP